LNGDKYNFYKKICAVTIQLMHLPVKMDRKFSYFLDGNFGDDKLSAALGKPDAALVVV